MSCLWRENHLIPSCFFLVCYRWRLLVVASSHVMEFKIDGQTSFLFNITVFKIDSAWKPQQWQITLCQQPECKSGFPTIFRTRHTSNVLWEDARRNRRHPLFYNHSSVRPEISKDFQEAHASTVSNLNTQSLYDKLISGEKGGFCRFTRKGNTQTFTDKPRSPLLLRLK